MQATEFVHISLKSIYLVLKDDCLIGMDIPVPNREISVLDSNKISKKSEFFVVVQKFQFLKLTDSLHKGHENEQFGKVSSKYMHLLGFYSYLLFVCFIRI